MITSLNPPYNLDCSKSGNSGKKATKGRQGEIRVPGCAETEHRRYPFTNHTLYQCNHLPQLTPDRPVKVEQCKPAIKPSSSIFNNPLFHKWQCIPPNACQISAVIHAIADFVLGKPSIGPGELLFSVKA